MNILNFAIIMFFLFIITMGFKRGTKVFITLSVVTIIIMWAWKFILVMIFLGIAAIIYLARKVKVYRNYDFRGFNSGYGNKYQNYSGFENFSSSGRMKEYYAELGVDENISDEELKKNHKKLVREYHPDMHHNKSEQERKVYEEKFKKINEAYENIKKSRGL